MGTFESLWATLGPQSVSGTLFPLLPHLLVPWASPAPWGLRKPWTFESLWATLGPQSVSGALFPLLPRLLVPWASLAPWGLRKPWEPSATLGPQSDSGALFPLPLHPWASLGLSKASESLSSLQQPWGLSQSQGLCSPCLWPSLGPSGLPEASKSLGNLQKPLATLAPQSVSGALLPLLPSCPWASFRNQEALRAFRSLLHPWDLRLRGLVPLAPLCLKIQGPCSSCSPRLPYLLNLPGPLGTFGNFWQPSSNLSLRSLVSPCPPHPWSSLAPLGLRKSWEPSEAFGSLGTPVRLRGLVLLAPLVPWASLGPWGLTWVSESLGNLWKPLTTLEPQSQEPCFPLPPHPWVSLDPGPQKALGIFGSLWQPCGLSLASPWPLPLWAPGASMAPQKALGTFGSLQQPWGLSQFQEPFSLCSPHPLSLSGASGSLWSLWQAWGLSQTQGPCSPCSPSPPGRQWGGKGWGSKGGKGEKGAEGGEASLPKKTSHLVKLPDILIIYSTALHFFRCNCLTEKRSLLSSHLVVGEDPKYVEIRVWRKS